MIQSMTGFAEKSFESPAIRVKMSIKSLNHRFFDWNYKGAPIGETENRLRVLCQNRLSRGRIEVILDIDFRDPSSWDIRINEGLLEKVLLSFQRVAMRLKKEMNFSVDNLFRIPQLMELKRKELSPAESAFLERGFLRTLGEVIRTRQIEGRKTAAQIKKHIGNVTRAIGRIEKLVKKQPRAVQQKLRQKLKELNGGGPQNEERMSEEVAYLTQRYDVSEEIQRLKSHLDAALKLVTSPKGKPAGKMLDFLAQELTREANTLNSKSQDIGITREGLLIKGEVESIRQQVQNLE
ncbi:MAG: YicC/YloC family endoribonuclease [Candidatus Aminicenantales bacterium]